MMIIFKKICFRCGERKAAAAAAAVVVVVVIGVGWLQREREKKVAVQFGSMRARGPPRTVL